MLNHIAATNDRQLNYCYQARVITQASLLCASISHTVLD